MKRHMPGEAAAIVVLLAVLASIVVIAVSENITQSRNQLSLGANMTDPSLALQVADLNAQEDMSAWAAAMFAASIGSLLVAATGIYFVRESLQESRNATRLATEQVRLSRQAMTSTERAFVGHDGCQWRSHLMPDGLIWWRIVPRWINTGSTPAQELRLFVAGGLMDRPLPDDFPFDVDVVGVPTDLRSNGTMHSAGFMISGAQVRKVVAGNAYFYIWGKATYRDIFEGTEEHETRFCVQLTGYGANPDLEWDEKTNPVDLGLTFYRLNNRAT